MSASLTELQEPLSSAAIAERGRRLRALKQLFTSTRVEGRGKPTDPAERALALQKLKELETEQLLGLMVEARLAGVI